MNAKYLITVNTRAMMVCLAASAVFGLSAIVWGQENNPSPVMGEDGIPEGYRFVEGDMLVPISNTASVYLINLWADGIVYYVFHPNVTPANQARAIAAMREWEAVANVRFVTPVPPFVSYLQIFDSTGGTNSNFSLVGAGFPGQPVSIFNWEEHFVIVHELGHALGFWHEQGRFDRNDFVRINYGNIDNSPCAPVVGCGFNFEHPPLSGEYGPYDLDSVMHYGQCDFSRCIGCPNSTDPTCTEGGRTITVLPPNEAMQNTIGHLDHLSKKDAMVMSFLYKQDDWVFVDNVCCNHGFSCISPQQNGTFGCPYVVNPSNNLQPVINLTPEDGTLWILSAANYSAGGPLARPMTIAAPLGATLTP